MGNTPSYRIPNNFNSSSFVQPGISEREVVELKNIFDGLEPINGFVEVSKIRALYKNSCKRNAMDNLFQGFDLISFDEFYSIMAQDMISTRMKYQNVEFDGEEPDANFFYCSYPQDRRTKI